MPPVCKRFETNLKKSETCESDVVSVWLLLLAALRLAKTAAKLVKDGTKFLNVGIQGWALRKPFFSNSRQACERRGRPGGAYVKSAQRHHHRHRHRHRIRHRHRRHHQQHHHQRQQVSIRFQFSCPISCQETFQTFHVVETSNANMNVFQTVLIQYRFPDSNSSRFALPFPSSA